MKDCAHSNAERGSAIIAAVAMLVACGIVRTAIGADWIAAPADLFKISDAIYLRWKPFENLSDVQGILSWMERLTGSI